MNDDKHSQKSGVSLISVCIPTIQYFVRIQEHKVRLYNANTLNHIDAIKHPVLLSRASRRIDIRC